MSTSNLSSSVPGGSVPDGSVSTAPRRLLRSDHGRIVGGVCVGIADYLRIDPVIVRIVLGVLAFFGGVGIVVYLVGWLLIPDARDGVAIVDLSRLGRSKVAQEHPRFAALAPVVVGVLLVFIAIGFIRQFVYDGPSYHGFFWLLVAATIGLAVVLLRGEPRTHAEAVVSPPRDNAAGVSSPPVVDRPVAGQTLVDHPTAGKPEAGQPQAGQPDTDQPEANQSEPLVPPVQPTVVVPPSIPTPPASPLPPAATDDRRPPRRKRQPKTTGLAWCIMAIVGGGIVLAGSANAFNWSTLTVLALLVGLVGVILLGFSWARRPGGFIATGMVLLLALLAIAPADRALGGFNVFGPNGERTWVPTAVDTNKQYELGAGKAVLDLDQAVPGLRVQVKVGAGQLQIRVPKDTTVVVDGKVGIGVLQADKDLPILNANRDINGDGSRHWAAGISPQGTISQKANVSKEASASQANSVTPIVVDAGVGYGNLEVIHD